MFLTVNLVLLLYTLCIHFCISRPIFSCQLECLGFLFGKLVLNLARVLLGYCFTYFSYYYTYQKFSYSSWFYNVYVVNVVFYLQALYQALVLIWTLITSTSEYVLFLFKGQWIKYLLSPEH